MKFRDSDSFLLSQIIRLRWLVGFLGSNRHSNWWDCRFIDETGIKFLARTFPRTAATAALNSTSEAAQKNHDGAIGRIGSFHLFRLPTSIEDHLTLNEKDLGPVPTKQSAMEELETLADALIVAPAGPVQVGVEKKILSETSIREMAAHYYSAFQQGIQCYPYFSADK